jgi:AcrR family transcriptional regulator
MLQAAAAMVSRTGLTVGLDHISFEDVIRDADVSRSAVYRHWPYKDLFFSDLVKELAKDFAPTLVDDELEVLRRVIAEHADWLDTAELRHGLVIELIRQLALLDFETFYGSAEWRTYIALHATFMSLAEGELRDEVKDVLAHSEQVRTARVAASWKQVAGLFGYRLRPELGATFETLATLVSATSRGVVIMALATTDIAAHRVQASPFGAAGKDEWSLPALGLASIATAFLEPDPDIEWDDARLSSVRQALRYWVPPDT